MDPADPQARAAAMIDALAEADAAERRFLRARWLSSRRPAPTDLFVAAASDGAPLAGFALGERKIGPFAIREIAGGYWPFRGVPVAAATPISDLADALARDSKRLGRIWRLGPAIAGDPALELLRSAAERAGWHAIERPLGQLYELDLAALAEDEPWPSTKTQRKNRWRKRRLEEDGGPIRIEFFTGADWTTAQRDAMGAIEAASWVGKLEDGGDTKFLDPEIRAYWESLCADPVLAAMICGSVMWIGDVPAAFAFGIDTGDVRYCIANNFDERFTQFGPGRVLLYDDFARAAEMGTRRISWGVGDAGYKGEMGAQPGEQLVDLLFVRGSLWRRLLKPLWVRSA
ncbi:GNAT family N-acetyltransferase [Qipengyuania flava]|nr:GNAT family N-acetyltransferase [Qipengyuania flava]